MASEWFGVSDQQKPCWLTPVDPTSANIPAALQECRVTPETSWVFTMISWLTSNFLQCVSRIPHKARNTMAGTEINRLFVVRCFMPCVLSGYFFKNMKSPPSSPTLSISPYMGMASLLFITASRKLENSCSEER